MTATKNAVGGKGFKGGHVDEEGKRKGMAGRPNSPARSKPGDHVRELRRRLWVAAKQCPERRFHALYDRMWRSDVLREAWKRVKKRRGSAGLDAQSIADVERYGVDRFLEEVAAVLRAGEYRGYRPKRSQMMALEALRELGKTHHHVLDADIRNYFGNISHDKLMKLVEKRVSDRRMLKLVRQWLQAGVMEDGEVRSVYTGVPQGGVISPLLSNIYLHVLDTLWTRHSAPLGTLVRYADDLVVVCKSKQQCEEAEKRVKVILARLGLELHPEKTRRVELYDGKQGFDFLGCHLHKRLSGKIWERGRRHVYFLHRWPSRRAMKRVREKVRNVTLRGRCHADLRVVIADLNPILRGWGRYFGTGNAAKHFNQIDTYVYERLRGLRVKRAGRQLSAGESTKWTRDFFWNLGLHRLRGTVKYPEAVTCR